MAILSEFLHALGRHGGRSQTDERNLVGTREVLHQVEHGVAGCISAIHREAIAHE
jgi:hypothetical protein